MYQIAIVDDDARDAALLRSLLCRYAEESGCGELRITCSEDGAAFLRGFTPAYDIVFFDIDMPGINGIEAAKKLREVAPDIAIVFVTNMAQYAIKGYEVEADDFVVKPVGYYDFSMKLDRVLKKLNGKDEDRIVVNNDGVLKYIAVRDIRYVEVIKHKVAYHTVEGVYEARGTLKKAEAQLPEGTFAKCNNYCLVNLRYVSSVKGYNVTLSRGRGERECDELPISHPRKKDFVKALGRYLGENA